MVLLTVFTLTLLVVALAVLPLLSRAPEAASDGRSGAAKPTASGATESTASGPAAEDALERAVAARRRALRASRCPDCGLQANPACARCAAGHNLGGEDRE